MLNIKMMSYPNGTQYGEFWIGDEKIGSADPVGDEWRVWGCKKPRTEQQAAREMLAARIKKLRRALIDAEKLMVELQSATA
jgi:hypothetical protein